MRKSQSSTQTVQPSQQELLPLNRGEASELARLNAIPDDKIGEEKLHRRAILRRRAQAHPTSFKQPATKQHKPTRPVRQKKQRPPMNTSRVATAIALLVLFGAIVWLIVLFVTSPSGQGVRDSAQEVVSNVQQVAAQATEGGGYECPPNIDTLTFDERGVLQQPYPTIEENPVNYCFRVEEYQNFLAMTGKLESDGEEITGLEWLAKTIAYPNYASMLDEVREALQAINLANNTDQIGWVQIPGHGGRQQSTPVPAPSNPNWNTTPGGMSGGAAAELEPTPTPEPEVADVPQFAEIPENASLGGEDHPNTTAADIADSMQEQGAAEFVDDGRCAREVALVYTVQPGDTMNGLSIAFCVEIGSIIDANNLAGHALTAGQRLEIPVPNNVYIKADEVAEEHPDQLECPTGRTNYTVVAGDTLYGLSVRFCTRPADIAAFNQKTTTDLTVGEQLVIPAPWEYVQIDPENAQEQGEINAEAASEAGLSDQNMSCSGTTENAPAGGGTYRYIVRTSSVWQMDPSNTSTTSGPSPLTYTCYLSEEAVLSTICAWGYRYVMFKAPELTGVYYWDGSTSHGVNAYGETVSCGD